MGTPGEQPVISPKVRSPSLLRKVTFAEGLTSPGGSALTSPTVRSQLKKPGASAGPFDPSSNEITPLPNQLRDLDKIGDFNLDDPNESKGGRSEEAGAFTQPTTTSVLLRRTGSQEVHPEVKLAYSYPDGKGNEGLASWPGPDHLPPPLKTPRRITDPAHAGKGLQRSPSTSPPYRCVAALPPSLEASSFFLLKKGVM